MSPRFAASDEVIQCATNVSEGRRPQAIASIVEASRVGGAVVADVSSDPDHNRTVISWLGSAAHLEEAVLAASARAAQWLDLTSHEGVHPRMGIVDVVPFTPIRNASMETCVALSLRVAETLARTVGLGVYLYEMSAHSGRPRSLPEIRRAASGWPHAGSLAPDIVPANPSARLGAAVVGARPALVAYNVALKEGGLEAARRIASDLRRLRDAREDLTGVRALGLYLVSRAAAQVSMNLTQPAKTPLRSVYAAVRELAELHGAQVGDSEVIGLVPAECIQGATLEDLRLTTLRPEQVIDNWIEA